MAYVESIWFLGSGRKNSEMQVFVKLTPAGDVTIQVPIPPAFYEAVLAMAQKAADLHESQMRAEILAEKEGESDDASNKL